MGVTGGPKRAKNQYFGRTPLRAENWPYSGPLPEGGVTRVHGGLELASPQIVVISGVPFYPYFRSVVKISPSKERGRFYYIFGGPPLAKELVPVTLPEPWPDSPPSSVVGPMVRMTRYIGLFWHGIEFHRLVLVMID